MDEKLKSTTLTLTQASLPIEKRNFVFNKKKVDTLARRKKFCLIDRRASIEIPECSVWKTHGTRAAEKTTTYTVFITKKQLISFQLYRQGDTTIQFSSITHLSHRGGGEEADMCWRARVGLNKFPIFLDSVCLLRFVVVHSSMYNTHISHLRHLSFREASDGSSTPVKLHTRESWIYKESICQY